MSSSRWKTGATFPGVAPASDGFQVLRLYPLTGLTDLVLRRAEDGRTRPREVQRHVGVPRLAREIAALQFLRETVPHENLLRRPDARARCGSTFPGTFTTRVA